jgi:nitroimidazol reductase NimA-like FMN-containing flavoprotein (pyridoxamine 5'-phosphate oxidase superfamily)
MDASDSERKRNFKTNRVTVMRRPRRGIYDQASITAILDATFICHIGFVVDGQPYIIPTSFGRLGTTLYFHGSSVSRMLNQASSDVPICLTATILDGIVLARSMFNHSMNYRSIVVLGAAESVDGDEKLMGLRAICDHIVPGRWTDARAPNLTELNATSVLKLEISEASAKVRSGPPIDDEEDLGLPYWAGVIPLALRAAQPLAEARVTEAIGLPEYIDQLVNDMNRPE